MTSPHPATPTQERGWPEPVQAQAPAGPGEGGRTPAPPDHSPGGSGVVRRVGLVAVTLHHGGLTSEHDIRALEPLIDIAEFDMVTRTERGWLVDSDVAGRLVTVFATCARSWWRLSLARVL